METKNILGLDLGSNSIGWAVINGRINDNGKQELTNIAGAGSRIIPMDASTLGDFSKGASKSQTKERTDKRGMRRLYERAILRRERLNRVLDILGFLPSHYSNKLDRYGKMTEEVRLAWAKESNGNYQFLFKDSFNEMLAQFQRRHPELVADGLKVPYDWTLYFLRAKALHSTLSKEELAWVLHSFNQKRGYNQARGEEEETPTSKKEEYAALKVIDVIPREEDKKGNKWYDIILDGGLIYKRKMSILPDWIGQVKEFIITTKLNKDGSPKEDEMPSLRLPKEGDWTLQKKKAEFNIENSGLTVGEYIYNTLLTNPSQKIRGKLVQHIDRKFYRDELSLILQKQIEGIPELRDAELYKRCIETLYQSNNAYRNSIANKGFKYLLIDDIIFYQRPLKSKKHLIADCPYESTSYITTEGEAKSGKIKCIAKSHPLFQELRLWQFIQNLKIYKRQTTYEEEKDVTAEFITNENERVRLYDFLNDFGAITQTELFSKFFGIKSNKTTRFPYRWNYVEDKKYPCNETRSAILTALKKANVDKSFLTPEIELHLWHILYSVNDKSQLSTAFERFAANNCLPPKFVTEFSKIKPFEKSYGSYSTKAIKKLLPLMREGKYWDYNNIDNATQQRIEKIISGEFDDNIAIRVREKAISLSEESHFKGLPLWLACYIVYNRHSEAKESSKWESPEDIDNYLNEFKQHSLRNPIVEQVVMETLRTVRDIWKQYGSIDEIHVELGREMKSTAEERKHMAQRIMDNENRNHRIKRLLAEFANPEYCIEGVKPYSPSQQEILKIYEEQALDNCSESDKTEFVGAFIKNQSPSHADFMRYKLWLEQMCISPYTGKPILLSKLFTPAYQIEHIIPQSRYFDDSLSNKVICEAEVNKLKDNQLGLEFIKNHHGEKVTTSLSKNPVEILSEAEYRRIVETRFAHSNAKRRKLLLEDIPEDFIARQMNDTRYISKLVMRLLSNIVREEGEEESTSKNVISLTGAITDRLKKDWGVNDAWNRIILPRFQRMNKITNETHFTSISQNGHEIPSMPLESQKGFNKKRIDHRHHAMDAIVIACATRNHVNLLNNEAARSDNNQMRRQLNKSLRRIEPTIVEKNGEKRTIDVAKEFLKPWDTFTADTEKALSQIVISFKQNLRIINKPSNKYQKIIDGKKEMAVQKSNDNWWAIRKPLHKDTVHGEVNLRLIHDVNLAKAINSPKMIVDKELKGKIIELLQSGYNAKMIAAYFTENHDIWQDVNMKRIPIYYFSKDEINPKTGLPRERYFATRTSIDSTMTLDKIEKVTDSGIREILKRHLESFDNKPEEAFSPEGIDIMNQNIFSLNGGKNHKPIYKVRISEKANKFPVGVKGNKSTKFVEAAKGTNLFFAVYESTEIDQESGLKVTKRSYASIPLNEVIDRLKKNLPQIPEDEDGRQATFHLSPNDLVYLPTSEEIHSGIISQPLDRSRIYKMVSCTGNECYFIPDYVASTIVKGKEFESNDKVGRAITGEMIKEICIPLKIDRLGNITTLKPDD